MAIFRTKRANNFTTIPNALIMDRNLSAKAKGVLIYLLSRPNNWQVSGIEVVKNFTDGKASIYKAIDELVEAGYIRKQVRYENGRLNGYNYDVYDQVTEIQETEKQDTENQFTENRELINTDITNTELTKYTSTKVDVSDKETFHSLVRKLGFTDKVIPTPKRLSQMKKRLKTYTVEELLAAADAVASNPWLQGENPQGKRYGTIDYLLRNDEQINNLLLDSKAVQPKSYFEQALERQNGAS